MIEIGLVPFTSPPGPMVYADCSATSGGWHFDNPSAPTKILLCATSCAVPLSASTAKVEILLGCARATANP